MSADELERRPLAVSAARRNPCAFCDEPVEMDDIDYAGNGIWIDAAGSSSCPDSPTERHSASDPR